LAWIDNFEDQGKNFEHLLPFAEVGNGDYYCFDYGGYILNVEVPVVCWSHETGETKSRGENFEDFLNRLRFGEFDSD